MDPSFPECSPLKVEDVTQLLDVYLTATYFQFEGKLYQQIVDITTGNPLSPVVSNVFMTHSEETSLHSADHKPPK
jgi:hypothetical protein